MSSLVPCTATAAIARNWPVAAAGRFGHWKVEQVGFRDAVVGCRIGCFRWSVGWRRRFGIRVKSGGLVAVGVGVFCLGRGGGVFA